MDKKFLNKVVDQIVSETEIDYDRKEIVTPHQPFLSTFSPNPFSLLLSPLPNQSHYFSRHCKNVYGLNEQEIEYVWDEYKKIILNKTNG